MREGKSSHRKWVKNFEDSWVQIPAGLARNSNSVRVPRAIFSHFHANGSMEQDEHGNRRQPATMTGDANRLNTARLDHLPKGGRPTYNERIRHSGGACDSVSRHSTRPV
jgi:hypothetical protein